MMKKVILVRHGQSLWNLEKRFTGWVDVDLTDNGKLEAKKSGELIKKEQLNIDLENYTKTLSESINSLIQNYFIQEYEKQRNAIETAYLKTIYNK